MLVNEAGNLHWTHMWELYLCRPFLRLIPEARLVIVLQVVATKKDSCTRCPGCETCRHLLMS